MITQCINVENSLLKLVFYKIKLTFFAFCAIILTKIPAGVYTEKVCNILTKEKKYEKRTKQIACCFHYRVSSVLCYGYQRFCG